MNKKTIFLLIAILTLAFFLRVYSLNKAPVELFGDEIDVGLQAKSILFTGKDYYGNFFPVMLHSFSEYRLPFFIYSAVPFVAVFGLNEWGVRLTGVFWGMLGILGIYLLTKEIFTKRIALIATFLAAISPWEIQFSRQGGIEALTLVTFIVFGIWTFIKGLNSFKWMLGSLILFSISIYVYATAVVFVPIYLLIVGLTFYKRFKILSIKKLGILLVVCLTILLPYLSLYWSGKASERFSTISVFSDRSLVDEITRRRQIEGNTSVATLFHNKAFVYYHEVIGNYFKALSAIFLFFQGDPNLRHSVGGFGEFYDFEFLTILIGLIWLFKTRPKFFLILVIWILVAPIPAALTRDGSYHAPRLLILFPPLLIISGLGINLLLDGWKKNLPNKIFILIIGVLAVVNFSLYLHRYFVEWPIDSWRFWQAGYKEMISYVKNNDSNYSRVYFNNIYEPALPRMMFWYGYDPAKFQANFTVDKTEKNILPGFDGFELYNKYYFGMVSNLDKINGIRELLHPGEIYIASIADEANLSDWRKIPPAGLKIVRTVTNPFNEPIFYIISERLSEGFKPSAAKPW